MSVNRDCVFRCSCFFFFQAEDGIRDLVRSRGLGDVYKRQIHKLPVQYQVFQWHLVHGKKFRLREKWTVAYQHPCLLYTSDAADERSSVDLGGRRIINKKKNKKTGGDGNS